MAKHWTLPYRPDIDGLRALAVMAVLLCHADLGVPGGFVGVDVFFVISGYLITGLMFRDLTADTFSIVEFWERRIRRIAPVLVVVVATTLLAGWFLLLPDAYRSLGASAGALGVAASNIYFWMHTGYFAADAELQPLLHTWSLAVEEQFYLVLPLALLLLKRAGQLHRAQVWFLIVFAGSLLASIYGVRHHPSATFYLLPTRAWELIVGAMLALRNSSIAPDRYARKTALSWLGLGCIAAPCVLYDETTPFPGLAAVPPVVGTAILIVVGNSAGRVSIVERGLRWDPLRGIGLISYSLYLWHWPLFVFARYHALGALSHFTQFSLIAASIALAAMSWRFIETPLRTGPLIRSRYRTLSFGAAAIVAMISFGMWIYGNNGIVERVPASAIRLASGETVDARYRHEHEVEDVPNGLVVYGDCSKSPRVLVWGDSHAMAILPAIERLSQAFDVCAIAATHSADPPVPQYFKHARSQFDRQARLLFKERVLEYCVSGQFDAVVLAANWNGHSHSPEFAAALLSTVDVLVEHKVRVFVMNSVPYFPFNVPRALSMSAVRGADPAKLAIDTENPAVVHQFCPVLMSELQQRGVTVLNPLPLLLDGQDHRHFLPVDGGESLYRDHHHLSTHGALMLVPLFEPIFRDAAAAKLSAQ